MPIIDPNVKRLYNERYKERRKELARKKREENPKPRGRPKVGAAPVKATTQGSYLPDNVAENQYEPADSYSAPDPPPPSPGAGGKPPDPMLPDPEPDIVLSEEEYIEYLKKRETPTNSEGLIQKILKAGLVTLIPQILQILTSAASKTIADRSNTETNSKTSSSQQDKKPAGLSIAFS